MTSAMLASATVDFGTGRTDVAVPFGTTIAGLLAMLRVDSADPDLVVTLSDGRPAALASAIGADLPSGTLLYLAGGRTGIDARTAARLRSASAHFDELGAAAAGLLFATALAAAVAAPLAYPLAVSQPARIAAALLGSAVLALGARHGRLLESPVWALVVPGLAGSLCTAVVDPAGTGSGGLALLVGAVVAALVATAVWLRTDGGAAAASAVLWAATAVVAAGGSLAGLTGAQLGTALLCLGVLAVALSPGFALQVPESQLLDLPSLVTSAPAVRADETAPPARITRRRVSATLGRAAAITDTGAVGGTAIAVAGGILLAPSAQPGTLPGQAALVALAAASLTLALLTRDHRSPLVRTAPRAGAALLTAATGSGLVATGVLPAALAVLGLMLVAGVVLLGALRLAQPQPSALLGRLADLGQAAALVVLLPAAVLASGLFDQVWRWAS